MKIRIWFILLIFFVTLSCTKVSTSPEDGLEAPSNFVLEQIDLESIQLAWQGNSSAEEGFRIDRKIGENEWEEDYQTLPENVTSFLDSGLETIGNYSYRISAYSNDDYSDTIEADIDFFYNEVKSIQATISQNNIINSFEFQFALLDSNGINVERDYDVWFKLLSRPEGTNLNGILYNTTDSLSVRSIHGIVPVTLNAGEQSGIAVLKCYVYDSNDNEISITKSNIVIHTSIPATVDFSIGEINSGINLGNGLWEIEVSVLLLDGQGNPIIDGTAVYFSLPYCSSWATINSAGYVGNTNANGDSIPGVAFTRLTYDGSHTNETIFVRIELGFANNFEGELVLPIQFPTIDIVAVPLHVDWWAIPPDPEYKSTEIRITLRDGQNNPVDNHIVVFSTTLGEPLEPIPPDTGDPYTGLTGVVNDEHGRLNKEVEFYYLECPPPIPSPPGTTTGTITAQVLGTNTSNQVIIILRRYVN